MNILEQFGLQKQRPPTPDNYNEEPVKPAKAPDLGEGKGTSPGFPARQAPPPIGDNPVDAPVPFEVFTHGEKEELRGYKDKIDEVEPEPYLVPVKVVHDVSDNYSTTAQFSIPPGQAMRIVGSIPGRFSAYVHSMADPASTFPIFLGIDDRVNQFNSWPLNGGDRSPEFKHDKEIWAYNSDTTNAVSVAVLAQYTQLPQQKRGKHERKH